MTNNQWGAVVGLCSATAFLLAAALGWSMPWTVIVTAGLAGAWGLWRRGMV